MHRMPRWVKVFVAIGLLLALLLAGALVFGGGRHGPGRHMSTGGDETSPARNEGNAQSLGGPAQAASATRTVEVATLDDMTFEPSFIEAAVGETITFVVTNRGEAAHEFVLGDEATQQERATMRSHMGTMAPHDGPNSVHLLPGETKQLTWRLGEASLVYACHEPGHYDAGMRGEIRPA